MNRWILGTWVKAEVYPANSEVRSVLEEICMLGLSIRAAIIQGAWLESNDVDQGLGGVMEHVHVHARRDGTSHISSPSALVQFS